VCSSDVENKIGTLREIRKFNKKRPDIFVFKEATFLLSTSIGDVSLFKDLPVKVHVSDSSEIVFDLGSFQITMRKTVILQVMSIKHPLPFTDSA
jgi:hypothetical protein